MRVQSLLFSRDEGWTPSRAKSWAESHGYKSSKVDVTDQYVRIRQADPKGFKTKRTVTFGRGIRAVVAREAEIQETSQMAKARRRRHSKKAPRRAKRARRKSHRARASVASPRRRRRRHKAREVAVAAPRRRRRRRMHAWRGNPSGHRKAAKKGWSRRRKKHARRRTRRSHEAYEMQMQSPRRRRRRSHRRAKAYAARAPRRYSGVSARRGSGMGVGTFVATVVAGGVGFVIADGLDRFMATYNPSSTAAKPADIFTSDGAGTLANTLNIASRPNWKRAAVAAGAVAVPAAGAYFVKNRMAKSVLEAMTVGTAISGLRLLVQTVMPMLVGKDTSTPALQKSFIARLYPAEVAAKISMAQKPSSAGVLSGAGADPGPFALSESPRYPDATQAATGTGYPSAEDALRQRAGVSDMPTAADALRREAGVAYQPGPPAGPGPGPTNSPEESCGCGEPGARFASFLGDNPQSEGADFR